MVGELRMSFTSSDPPGEYIFWGDYLDVEALNGKLDGLGWRWERREDGVYELREVEDG
jgi:hypothetical protein